MSAATVAASRGHAVTLFEANADVGGQFNFAKVVRVKKNFTKRFATLKYNFKNWGRCSFKYSC